MAITQIRGNTQILNLSVTNTQIALPDASNPKGILLAKIEDGALLVKSNGTVAFTAPVSGVSPVGPADIATKQYVDNVAQGLDVKISARAIATSNIVLSGTQVIDGVSLVAGDRVLVAGQTTASQNGIYLVAAGGWTRSADAIAGEVRSGMFTFIDEGTLNASTGWVQTAPNPITVGTSNLAFAQFSQAGVIQGGGGLLKTGNVIDVVSANGGIVVSPHSLALTLDGTTLAITANGIKLADIGAGKLLVGNLAGIATAVTISGDITIDNNGVATLAAGAVKNGNIADGSLLLTKLVSGTAGQMIIASATGVPTYVTASGAITVSSTGLHSIVANAVGTTQLANASVTLAKLAVLPAGQIIIGTAAGVNTAVTLSGDVTVSETGVVTINPATVVRVSDIITRETPAGLVNGTNMTFTLAYTPKIGTEKLFVNGIMQDAGTGNDYTISGSTITMLYALISTDKLRVCYFK